MHVAQHGRASYRCIQIKRKTTAMKPFVHMGGLGQRENKTSPGQTKTAWSAPPIQQKNLGKSERKPPKNPNKIIGNSRKSEWTPPKHPNKILGKSRNILGEINSKKILNATQQSSLSRSHCLPTCPSRSPPPLIPRTRRSP